MNIIKLINNSIDNCFDYVEKARVVAELSRLSDRQLMDIGMSRDDIKTTVTELWASNKTDAAAPVIAGSDNNPAKTPVPAFDLGTKLASLYSRRDANNPTGLVV